MRIWTGCIGKNGRIALAPKTLNIFPKLELVPMRIYLTILEKVWRPILTPDSRTNKFFSSKMMSPIPWQHRRLCSTEILGKIAVTHQKLP
jgi:hypothetical protein